MHSAVDCVAGAVRSVVVTAVAAGASCMIVSDVCVSGTAGTDASLSAARP
jgi:hypothetical protein